MLTTLSFCSIPTPESDNIFYKVLFDVCYVRIYICIILQHNQVYDIDIINISTGLYNCVIMLLKKLLSPPELQTFQCFYL